MQTNNIIWTIQVYPLSDFREQFNSLSLDSQNAIENLLRELVILVDPENHPSAIGCPRIQGFNHAIQYVLPDDVVLIIALDRILLGHHNDRMITLFTCSE